MKRRIIKIDYQELYKINLKKKNKTKKKSILYKLPKLILMKEKIIKTNFDQKITKVHSDRKIKRSLFPTRMFQNLFFFLEY